MTSRYNVPDPQRAHLTRRQLEVLGAYLDGCETREEVAKEVGVTKRTIDFHMRLICERLGVKTTVGAICKALRVGMMKVRVNG